MNINALVYGLPQYDLPDLPRSIPRRFNWGTFLFYFIRVNS